MVNLADLPSAGALSGSETLPMQQGSGAVKVTALRLVKEVLALLNIRMDNSGRLMLNTTSNVDPVGNAARLVVRSDGDTAIYVTGHGDNIGYGIQSKLGNAALNNSGWHFRLYDSDGTPVGGIYENDSTISYVTISDYRLKENEMPISDPIGRVMALRPINFAWKATGERIDGFLAHEVQAVVPEVVTGEKDAVDDQGKPIYQGMDHSKLVPLLTAALQTVIGEIESLRARVAALEAAT